MSTELTIRAVEFLVSPYDDVVHIFGSAQVARMTRGPVRAWCTQLVPVELLIPTLGELCPSCRLVFLTHMPGYELPTADE